MSWTQWLFGRRHTPTRSRAEDMELWLQPHVRQLEARRVLAGNPMVMDFAVDLNEDTTFTFTEDDFTTNYADNEVDEDNPLVSITITSGPTSGSLTLNGAEIMGPITAAQLSTLRYVPNADINGTDSFSWTASDGTGSSNSAAVTLNIAAVDDDPVVADSTVSATEDTDYTFSATDFTGAFSDVDGDTLTKITITQVPGTGTLKFDGADLPDPADIALADLGKLTYEVVDDFNGNVTLQWTATANGVESNTGSMTINVAAVDDDPVVVDSTVSTTEDTDYTFTASDFTGAFSDVDGDTLTKITITQVPGTGTLKLDGADLPDPADIALADLGKLTYEVVDDFNGNVTLQWTATANGVESNTGSMSINVAAVDDDPVVVDSTVSTTEDTDYTFTASDFTGAFSDVDGDTLTKITITQVPGSGTLKLDGADLPDPADIALADLGKLTYEVVGDFNGNVTLQWTATANGVESNTGSMTINVAAVNDPPTVDDATFTLNEDSTFTFTQANFTSLFNDNDGDSLTEIQINSLPSSGTLAVGGTPVTLGATVSAANLMNLTYVPAANVSGDFTFSWSANDGTVFSPTGTITMSVAAVNDVPTVSSASVSADEEVRFDIPATTFTDNIDDVEGDSIDSIRIESLPSRGVLRLNNSVVMVNDVIDAGDFGNLNYTGNLDLFGADSFTWSASDDGTNYSAVPATLTINVSNVADVPTVSDTSIGATEETLLSIPSSTFTDNITDVDSPFLHSIRIESLPTDGTLRLNMAAVTVNQVIRAADIGGLNYTGDLDFFGTDGFTWSASNDGVNYSADPATLSIVVANVQDAPLVSDLSIDIDEDVPYTFAIEDFEPGFSDVDGEEIARIRITSLPTNGILSLGAVPIVLGVSNTFNANLISTLTYTPGLNFQGTDSFGWTASDGNEFAAVPAVMTINIASVNDPPVGGDDSFLVLEDIASTWDASELLANDNAGGGADEAGQTVSLRSVSASSAQGGTVTRNDDGFGNISVTYTPPTDFVGTDSYTYTLEDDGTDAATSTVTVTLQVLGVNDAPVVTGTNKSIGEDNVLTTTVNATNGPRGGGLSALAREVGQVLTFSPASTLPVHGTVDISPTGTITYTPSPNFSGTDSFTFRVTDDGVSNRIEMVEDPDNLGTFIPTAVEFADPRFTDVTVNITVDPVVDVPVSFTPNQVTLRAGEGSILPIDLSGQLQDTDGSEVLQFVVEGVPTSWSISSPNATFTRNGGTLTITPLNVSNGFATVRLNAFSLNESTATLTSTARATELALASSETPFRYSSESSLNAGFDNVAPTVVASATPVTADSITMLTLQVTDPGIQDPLFVTINWTDGTIETLSVTQAPITVSHFFVGPPDPNNPAAPIDIIVTASDGVAQTSEVARADVPSGGITTVSIDTTRDFAITDLVIVDRFINTLDTESITPQITQPVGLLAGAGESLIREGSEIVLRVVSVDGKESDNIPLPANTLTQLRRLFTRLPDGHYRMYMLELGTERQRMIFDLFVRQGRAVNPLEVFEETGVGAVANKQLVPDAKVATEQQAPVFPTTGNAVDPAAGSNSTEETGGPIVVPGTAPANGSDAGQPDAADGAALEREGAALAIDAAAADHPWNKMARRMSPAASLLIAATVSAQMSRSQRTWNQRVQRALDVVTNNPLSQGARWRRKITGSGSVESPHQ